MAPKKFLAKLVISDDFVLVHPRNSQKLSTPSLPAVYRPNNDARTMTAGTPQAGAKIISLLLLVNINLSIAHWLGGLHFLGTDNKCKIPIQMSHSEYTCQIGKQNGN